MNDPVDTWQFWAVFLGVPDVLMAVFAWRSAVYEPRAWAATKAFLGMLVLPVAPLFGMLPHLLIWVLLFVAPFAFGFDRVDRLFGGRGIDVFD